VVRGLEIDRDVKATRPQIVPNHVVVRETVAPAQSLQACVTITVQTARTAVLGHTSRETAQLRRLLLRQDIRRDGHRVGAAKDLAREVYAVSSWEVRVRIGSFRVGQNTQVRPCDG